jgi:arabinoxylan arabinofuranohydrolase
MNIISSLNRSAKSLYLLSFLLLAGIQGYAQQGDGKYSAYLFTYFTGNGNGEEAIRFALSNDGYNYRALNKNRPVLNTAQISATGGVRDPHILRGADGKTFYMVATDMHVAVKGWGPNLAMVLMKSRDLINWTSQSVNIPKAFPELAAVNRVWAPQTIYDPQEKKYMIYWAMRFGNTPDKLYYAYANSDFTGLETAPKQLFFSPDNAACIDADIILKDGKYHLFFKTEDRSPGIKKAVSDHLTEGYVMYDKYLQQTTAAVEGSGTFKINNSDNYILMYDMYMSGKYQFTQSKDLLNFQVIDNDISMDFHPRHGTVMPITAAESAALAGKWLTPDDVMRFSNAAALKKEATVQDTSAGTLLLKVVPGTGLSSFDPGFITFPGVTLSPEHAANFSKGSVKYTLRIKGQPAKIYIVSVMQDHNPVLKGLFADPEILYAEKTGKFYIYPTSDGFDNWSGTYFKAFSSPDLAEWKDEGIILDLKDVSWAKRNAWAPCIIEKKIDNKYKYFYYFVAAQKIGVAVSDSPTGPFTDSGKPLIDQYPAGITRGQQIDPDVFTDPKTGISYLYWGNGYMAGAELNDDMISIKPGTTKVLTPDRTYNEGTYVIYRNGLYYFMWSENDTRSEDYRVRYGTSASPLGKIDVPDDNLVIAKDRSLGIYGTGHNSVIQVPGKDEWYLVYHRFSYPKGITMGGAAGYNREVCIDKLEFTGDGKIKQVRPSHTGIQGISFKK